MIPKGNVSFKRLWFPILGSVLVEHVTFVITHSFVVPTRVLQQLQRLWVDRRIWNRS